MFIKKIYNSQKIFFNTKRKIIIIFSIFFLCAFQAHNASAGCSCECMYTPSPITGMPSTITYGCDSCSEPKCPSNNGPTTFVSCKVLSCSEPSDDVPMPVESAPTEPVKNIFFSGLDETANKTGHLDSNSPGSGLAGRTLTEIISLAISLILGLVGVVFLILLIIGGYLWMTSLGNDQQVERAKNIMRNSIIGLALIIAAYAILSVVNILIKFVI